MTKASHPLKVINCDIHGNPIMFTTDHGPQKRPASVRQIEAQRKSLANELTDHDWLQIEMAARGCIDGTSDQWPSLRIAIEKITGSPFGPRKTANWMQGFCEGVMIQSGRERE